MVLLISRIAQDHPNGDFASRLATRESATILRILPFPIPIGEAIGKGREKEKEKASEISDRRMDQVA